PGVGDDGGVGAGDQRVVIPVGLLAAVGGDVAVGQIEVEQAVVVEVAELRPPAPTAALDVENIGLVLVANVRAGGVFLGHPEVVALEPVARLGNVADVNGQAAVIEDVAETGVHAALGGLGDARALADLDEVLALLVGVQLGDPVVVGQEQVGIAAAAQ